VGHVALKGMWRKKYRYRILAGKPETKKITGRTTSRAQENSLVEVNPRSPVSGSLRKCETWPVVSQQTSDQCCEQQEATEVSKFK
jgi:hypothetical protein